MISAPTPVEPLRELGRAIGHARLFVKREDATAPGYGGNKVRNLEFLLGDAVTRNARRLVTIAPRGSNFVAAMAAQARRIGMPSDVFHFIPARSPQIEAHAVFSRAQGARLHEFGGGRYVGALRAASALALDAATDPGAYWIAPGGSSVLGTLGHVRAVFELARQIERGELPEPDRIVVGVGTCGTLAGLLAGIRLTGLRTRVIGVRCVDPLVCNPRRVAKLANAALAALGSTARLSSADVDLRDLPHLAYGEPIPNARETMDRVRSLSGIELDTTYTSKVFSFLERIALSGELERRDVLYWHTFSPAAMQAAPAARAEAEIFAASG